MDRVRYSSHPPRHDYRLTARGRQMWPILLTMWAWEREWVDDPSENLPEMRHTKCGKIFAPVMVCEACGQPVEARDVEGRFGPSGGWERSMPSAATRRRAHSGHRPTELIAQTMALIGNRWSAAMLGRRVPGGHPVRRVRAADGRPADHRRRPAAHVLRLGVLTPSPNPQRPDWVVYHLLRQGPGVLPGGAPACWSGASAGSSRRRDRRCGWTHSGCGRAFHAQLSAATATNACAARRSRWCGPQPAATQLTGDRARRANRYGREDDRLDDPGRGGRPPPGSPASRCRPRCTAPPWSAPRRRPGRAGRPTRSAPAGRSSGAASAAGRRSGAASGPSSR